ncbi:MAG: hypothetical protein LBD78_02810 [Spirochaetaceae bacterium]|jgi:hypothetical protein|nr:hypothetical protein [Spirochaetaceae bacterium]
MTLSSRNYLFRAGIVVSVLTISVIVGTSFVILPLYPALLPMAARRSTDVVRFLVGNAAGSAPYIPFITMSAACFYAFITMIFIYYYFEKTQAPEILFFALFALSLTVEASRIMVPLRMAYELPTAFLVMASRGLLFGRFFGVFSLFAASLYAAGLEMRKQGNILLIIALLTLILAIGVPIDGMSWDSTLSMIYGYSSMFRLVETGLVLITTITFFVSAYSRGSGEYVFIGIGVFLVYIGRNMLLGADTWIAPIPGMAILIAGTWFICSRLHRVYLWL